MTASPEAVNLRGFRKINVRGDKKRETLKQTLGWKGQVMRQEGRK